MQQVSIVDCFGYDTDLTYKTTATFIYKGLLENRVPWMPEDRVHGSSHLFDKSFARAAKTVSYLNASLCGSYSVKKHYTRIQCDLIKPFPFQFRLCFVSYSEFLPIARCSSWKKKFWTSLAFFFSLSFIWWTSVYFYIVKFWIKRLEKRSFHFHCHRWDEIDLYPCSLWYYRQSHCQ